LDIPSPDISWGAVMGEYLVNHYLDIALVSSQDRLASVWARLKMLD
jgi:hypothetical protein